MLKLKPIKKYKSPIYPEQRAALENPNLLKTLPQRWKGKAFAGLAFYYIALVLLSGCEEKPPTGGTPMPPVYLSEEEAYNVIADEAAKYGVIFDKAGIELQDLELRFGNQATEDKALYKLNIQLDGYNKEKKVGFEFISQNDMDEINNNITQLNNKDFYPLWIEAYNDKLEQAVRENKRDNKEEINFDAFYTSGSGTTKEKEAALREQVKSFMEWLKTQGVI